MPSNQHTKNELESGSSSNQQNYVERGFRVSPTEIRISESCKERDAFNIFQDFEAAAHDLKKLMEPGLKPEMIKAEHEVQNLIEQTHFEKHSGLEYIEVLAKYSANNPTPTRATVWAKFALIDKFMKSAEAAGHVTDRTFLISSQLDLAAEIGASGMLEVKESKENKPKEKNIYRTENVLRYMSSTISVPASLYYFAFDQSDKVDQYFVERAMCTLYAAYSDEARLKNEAGMAPGERTKDTGFARRTELDGLISGIRAEAATWMYFDIVFDELTSVPNLLDETLVTKFGFEKESEEERAKSVEQLRALLDEIIEASAFGEEPFELLVKHAPPSLDRRGIADLVIIASEPKDPKNTEGAGKKKLKQTPVLLIEVKSFTPKQPGDPMRFSGVYLADAESKVIPRPVEYIDNSIFPKTPDAAGRRASEFGDAVLSVRVPNNWTNNARSTVEEKEENVSINGVATVVRMQNITKTLETMRSNHARETSSRFREVVTTLLKNQNLARRQNPTQI